MLVIICLGNAVKICIGMLIIVCIGMPLAICKEMQIIVYIGMSLMICMEMLIIVFMRRLIIVFKGMPVKTGMGMVICSLPFGSVFPTLNSDNCRNAGIIVRVFNNSDKNKLFELVHFHC